jgi:HD-GYP domain-containing protein (c-di-GMP phosphodiesterase class II)
MDIKKISGILNRMVKEIPEIFVHSERIAMLCYVTGKELKLSPEETELVYFAGLLHEVGRLDIHNQILISNDQKLVIDSDKLYPFFTVSILKNYEEFAKLEDIIIQHQENYDGSGYPNGLKGDEIKVSALILRLADFYDCLRINGLTHDEATKELRKNSEIICQKKMITAFIKSVVKNNLQNEYGKNNNME